MVEGWRIVVERPGTIAPATLQTWLLVALADREDARQRVAEQYPQAAIRVDSAADSEALAKYNVLPGEIFTLVEGS